MTSNVIEAKAKREAEAAEGMRVWAKAESRSMAAGKAQISIKTKNWRVDTIFLPKSRFLPTTIFIVDKKSENGNFA